MATLIDPTIFAEQVEAKVRTVMAMRVGLQRIPGTHEKRAEMLTECDELLDEYLAIGHG